MGRFKFYPTEISYLLEEQQTYSKKIILSIPMLLISIVNFYYFNPELLIIFTMFTSHFACNEEMNWSYDFRRLLKDIVMFSALYTITPYIVIALTIYRLCLGTIEYRRTEIQFD